MVLSRLFGQKKAKPMTFVVARLNAKVQPIDRGDRYEDPLDEILKRDGLGEVTGGGTQLGELGEIEFCDIEIGLNVDPAEAIPVIKEALERFGAPKGSELLLTNVQAVPFGRYEGLALYLNGTDLPDDVYRDHDVNDVYAEIGRLLGSEGEIQGYWNGPTDTALYLYGPSFERLGALIANYVAGHPLGQQSRVVQIA